MAVTHDSGGGVSGGIGLTSLSWSHNVTVADCVLIAVVHTGSTSSSTTGVTHNGVAMTQIGGAWGFGPGTQEYSTWYILNPATGSKTITATFSAATNLPGAASDAYSGSDLTAFPDAYSQVTTNPTSSSPVSMPITTSADNCRLYAVANIVGGGTVASGTSDITNGSSNPPHVFESTSLVTPAGSASLSYTFTGGGLHAVTYALFSIAPAAVNQNVLFRMT